MTIRVEIDGKGTVAEFPDGTPESVIDAAIKRDFFGGGPAETAQPGVWEGLVKPTLTAIPKVVGTAAAGLASMPVAGLTGLGVGSLAAIDRLRGKDVDPWIEANRAMEAVAQRGNMVTTPAEAGGLESLSLAMKPFEWAREAGGAAGRATGIPYAEPVLGTIGEGAAMAAMPWLARRGGGLAAESLRRNLPSGLENVMVGDVPPTALRIRPVEAITRSGEIADGRMLAERETANIAPEPPTLSKVLAEKERVRPFTPEDDALNRGIIENVSDLMENERAAKAVVKSEVMPERPVVSPEVTKVAPDVIPEAAPKVPEKPPTLPVGETSPVVKATVAKKVAPANKGPQNAITYLENEGGVNWGESYNYTEMRQHPDGKRISRKSGMSPDEAAARLNDEGFVHPDGQPWTADKLAESVKANEARKSFTPDKADDMLNRQVRREHDEWAREQASLAEEGIDAGRIETGRKSVASDLIEEARAQGIDLPEEVIAKELDDFFTQKAQINAYKGKTETAEIPGASAKETFTLANPETEIGVLQPKDRGPGTGKMF